MQLVLNVNYKYDLFTAEECALMVKKAGFDAVDYGLFAMIEPTNPLNGDHWLDAAEKAKTIYQNAGVPIVQAHAPFQFKGLDQPGALKEQAYPRIVRSIEAAAAMGAKHIVVHPWHHIPYYENRQELLELNVEFYRSLIPVAKNCGIKIAVENMFQRDKLRGGYIVDSTCSRPEEFCRYIDTLNSEYIVACLDIGHTVLISGNVDPWDFIRILGRDRLKTLHVHDNDYKNDRHITPFSGSIDWYKVTEALGQIDYTGEMVYECLINNVVNKLTKNMYPTVLEHMARIGRHLIEQVEINRQKIR